MVMGGVPWEQLIQLSAEMTEERKRRAAKMRPATTTTTHGSEPEST
jgi:hypothetical protein